MWARRLAKGVAPCHDQQGAISGRRCAVGDREDVGVELRDDPKDTEQEELDLRWRADMAEQTVKALTAVIACYEAQMAAGRPQASGR